MRWGNHPIPKTQQDLKFTYYDSSNKILSKDESYKRWKTLFDNIAEKSLSKDIKVIVFNSFPSFPEYGFKKGTEWFNSSNKVTKFPRSIKRNYLIKNYQLVDSTFNALANKYSNVEVFDVFSEICPTSQIFCTSEKYKDLWHLSPQGAISLYEGLLKKLN